MKELWRNIIENRAVSGRDKELQLTNAMLLSIMKLLLRLIKVVDLVLKLLPSIYAKGLVIRNVQKRILRKIITKIYNVKNIIARI